MKKTTGTSENGLAITTKAAPGDALGDFLQPDNCARMSTAAAAADAISSNASPAIRLAKRFIDQPPKQEDNYTPPRGHGRGIGYGYADARS